MATLPGARRYRVSAGTDRPGVSILWLGEVESWICNFYLSVAARKIVWADPSLRYTSMLLGRLATNKQTVSLSLSLSYSLSLSLCFSVCLSVCLPPPLSLSFSFFLPLPLPPTPPPRPPPPPPLSLFFLFFSLSLSSPDIGPVIFQDVDFELYFDSDNSFVGQDFELVLICTNKSKEARTICGRVSASTMFYTGIVANPVGNLKIEYLELGPGESGLQRRTEKEREAE